MIKFKEQYYSFNREYIQKTIKTSVNTDFSSFFAIFWI